VAAVDVGSALMVLALLLAARVVAEALHDAPALPGRLSARGPLAAFAAWTLGVVFLVLVGGVLVAEKGSLVRCLGWPLVATAPGFAEVGGWLALTRRVLALAAGASVAGLGVQVWRRHRREPGLRRAATLAMALLAADVAIGVALTKTGPALPLLIGSVAGAVGLWAALVVLTVRAALADGSVKR
jgi:heme A synthase